MRVVQWGIGGLRRPVLDAVHGSPEVLCLQRLGRLRSWVADRPGYVAHPGSGDGLLLVRHDLHVDRHTGRSSSDYGDACWVDVTVDGHRTIVLTAALTDDPAAGDWLLDVWSGAVLDTPWIDRVVACVSGPTVNRNSPLTRQVRRAGMALWCVGGQFIGWTGNVEPAPGGSEVLPGQAQIDRVHEPRGLRLTLRTSR